MNDENALEDTNSLSHQAGERRLQAHGDTARQADENDQDDRLHAVSFAQG